MTFCIGLTDDPEDMKQQLGNPSDWEVSEPFSTEQAARNWEIHQLANGHMGGPGDAGWRFAYWYTVSGMTIEKEKHSEQSHKTSLLR